MSDVIGTVDGAMKLMAKLQAISDSVERNMKLALVDSALAIHTTAVQSILSHQSSDKTVKLYNPSREHDVSSPMETPNSDLGTLAQSIEFNIDEGANVAEVGTNLKYGAYLEYGTMTMAPRPWLYPAVHNNEDNIKGIFQVQFEDGIKKGAS